MKCSALNNELYNLNIIDSPKCACTAQFEDAEHYFLQCPLYNDLRTDLTRNLNSIHVELVLKTILDGNSARDKLTNIIIVSYVQDYINNTDRF